MGVEICGVPCGVGAGTPCLASGAALRSLDGSARSVALVHVANDGGEVSVADTRLAAARIRAEPPLGVVKILERVAAECSDERLARPGHRVLGVDGFEEQASGAILGAGIVALLLDDRAEHVGVLAVERMAEVSTPGGVDAQEGGDEQRGDVTREHGIAKRGNGSGSAVEHVEQRRERVLDGAEAAFDGRFLESSRLHAMGEMRCVFASPTPFILCTDASWSWSIAGVRGARTGSTTTIVAS